MNNTSPARATAIVTTLFVVGLCAGALTGIGAVARAQDPYAHLDLFARVFSAIERDYVDEVPPEVLVEGAIEGMVSKLDRQSRWLSARQMQNLQEDTEGASVGIGVQVAAHGQGAMITSVLPGSPAGRQGLNSGDVILEIDGKSLAGLSVGEITSLVHGNRGDAAVLKILSTGQDRPREVRTVHDRTDMQNVEAIVVDDVVYARLVQFRQGAGVELELTVSRLSRQNGGWKQIRGLVLDLRDNPGGLLTEAVAVSDLFLDDGVIVSTRDRGDTDQSAEIHRATEGGFPADLSLVVLVNGHSASASEIVAAAIQETGRGTVIGETTWGKGTVQQVYRHSGDTALKLTVGRYYTAGGKPVADRTGREPDVTVAQARPPTVAEELRTRITALDLPEEEVQALEALLQQIPEQTTKPEPIDWQAQPADRATADPVIAAAVEHLRR